ncbi:DUF2971 domain-containing protein [Psychroserpens damuponensis]|uniref:DUF2971 domain-containing protein n=1 Tax=Psychroserpens damuponensis TaxID=943936 RepID=UPI001379297E|nr:DUF2971 domain-containing protein [Psychroserpens damuponensis]
MNDPFECLASVDRKFDKEQIQSFKKILVDSGNKLYKNFHLHSDETINKLANSFRKTPLDKYAFCSFSEDPNNILMWTHYANNHSGLVIGFEFPELKNNNNLQKVRYQNQLDDISLTPYANFILGKEDGYLDEILRDYSIKSEHWMYEREWRLWRTCSGYFRYKPENIKEVHFGLNMPIETKAILIKLLSFLPKEFDFKQKELNYNPIGLK